MSSPLSVISQVGVQVSVSEENSPQLKAEAIVSALESIQQVGNQSQSIVLPKDIPETAEISDVKVGGDSSGNTPLHLAAEKGQFERAKLLLAGGANRGATNVNGETPIDLAIKAGQDDLIRLLIDPTISKSANVDSSIPYNSEDVEGTYYKRFEQAYEEGDALNQMVNLEKLAAFYINKNDYRKASYLVNNILAAVELYEFDQEYQELLLARLLRVEDLLLKELNIQIPQRSTRYLSQCRLHLKTVRKNAQLQLEKGIPIEKIQMDLTEGFQALLRSLVNNSIDFLGTPPTFTLIGLGSMSRSEMSPYSDVEFAILIQEDTDDVHTYFRRLSRLLELRVLNLGETFSPLLPLKKIGEIIIEAKSFTPRGFSMDSGGLSPLGKTGVYELIGLPEQLASFQEPAWLETNSSEEILVNALTSSSFVMGNEELFQRYRKSVTEELNKKDGYFGKSLRQKRALKLLKGHIDEFKPVLDEQRIDNRAFDVKKDLYRPLQMIIGTLALYYGLNGQSTLYQLRTLHKAGIFNDEGVQRLQKVLSHALKWRLKAHFFYKREREIVYYAQYPDDPKAAGLLTFNDEESKTLEEMFSTLIPLHEAAKAFLEGNEKSFRSSFEYSLPTSVDPHASYETRETTSIQLTALNPNNLGALFMLTKAKSELGHDADALRYQFDHLNILKRRHLNDSHPDVANCLANIGTSYFGIGEFALSIEYSEQALKILKEIHGDNPHPLIASVLQHLGAAYIKVDQLNKAVKLLEDAAEILRKIFEQTGETYTVFHSVLIQLGDAYKLSGESEKSIGCFHLSLEMSLRMHKDKPHPDIAVSLTELGTVYKDLGKIDEAIKYHRKSLKILKQLFPNKPHPNIASVLSNLGICYKLFGDADKAIKCYEKSLVIKRQIFKDKPHPTIATTLNNMGAAYRNKDLSKSIEYYELALAMQRQIYPEEHTENALLFSNLGSAYSDLKQIDKALEYLYKALAMYRQILKNTPNVYFATTLGSLGTAYAFSQEKAKAIPFYESALDMFRELYGFASHFREAQILKALGLVYEQLGQIENAATHFRQSLEVRLQLNSDIPTQETMEDFHILKEAFDRLGMRQEAAQCQEQIVEIDKIIYANTPTSGMAAALAEQGLAYRKNGQLEEALECYKKALLILNRINKGRPCSNSAIILNNIGNAYRCMGKVKRSIKFFEKALKMMRHLYRTDQHSDVAAALNSLGLAHLNLGEISLAIKYCGEGLAIMENIDRSRHPFIPTTLLNLGLAYEKAGQLNLAITYYEKGIKMMRRIHGRSEDPQIEDALNHLGDIYKKLGQLDKALECYAQSSAIGNQLDFLYYGFNPLSIMAKE